MLVVFYFPSPAFSVFGLHSYNDKIIGVFGISTLLRRIENKEIPRSSSRDGFQLWEGKADSYP